MFVFYEVLGEADWLPITTSSFLSSGIRAFNDITVFVIVWSVITGTIKVLNYITVFVVICSYLFGDIRVFNDITVFVVIYSIITCGIRVFNDISIFVIVCSVISAGIRVLNYISVFVVICYVIPIPTIVFTILIIAVTMRVIVFSLTLLPRLVPILNWGLLANELSILGRLHCTFVVCSVALAWLIAIEELHGSTFSMQGSFLSVVTVSSVRFSDKMFDRALIFWEYSHCITLDCWLLCEKILFTTVEGMVFAA